MKVGGYFLLIKLRLMEDREFPLTLGQKGINSNPLLDHLCRPRRS